MGAARRTHEARDLLLITGDAQHFSQNQPESLKRSVWSKSLASRYAYLPRRGKYAAYAVNKPFLLKQTTAEIRSTGAKLRQAFKRCICLHLFAVVILKGGIADTPRSVRVFEVRQGLMARVAQG